MYMQLPPTWLRWVAAETLAVHAAHVIAGYTTWGAARSVMPSAVALVLLLPFMAASGAVLVLARCGGAVQPAGIYAMVQVSRVARRHWSLGPTPAVVHVDCG